MRSVILSGLAVVALCVAVSPAAAQRQDQATAGMRQVTVVQDRLQDPPADSIPRTHWVGGVEVGGAVGLGIAVLLNSFVKAIGDDGPGLPVTFFIGSTAVCALIGGMIGSLLKAE